MFPTLAVTLEGYFADDIDMLYDSIHAFNRWLADDWGFAYQGRIFGAGYVCLMDVTRAITELEWLLQAGTRAITIRPCPPYGRSPADPHFDPFWARVEEADVLVTYHAFDGPSLESAAFREQRRAKPRGMTAEYHLLEHTVAGHDKFAMDTFTALILHNLFGRFPKLRMRSLTSGLSGHVAVGMTPTVAYFLAQPLLERMAEAAPEVVLRIVEGTGLHLGEGLTTGELDMGLLYEALHDRRLVNHDLLTEDLVVVGAAGSVLAADRALTIGELTQLPLILPNPKNGLRSITERYAAKYAVHFRIKYVIDSFPVLKEMVGGGHGYTITPLSSVLREVEAGTLVYSPMENPSRRTLVVATKTHCRIPRVMAKVQEVMEEVLCDLHQQGRIFGSLRIKRAGNLDKPALMVA